MLDASTPLPGSAVTFPIEDTVGAWVPHGKFVVPATQAGTLSGLTFAVKDLFDVAGRPTGAGNPVWLATHEAPTANSPLIDQLLDAGATLCGKVLTDELAYSINGDNIHYGTPINAAAPDRVTGGSSSGSAAAVTAALVDFALGTDTGGSTRVPASYCGIWGLRTTHGALSQQGLVPLHPNYDTPTWLAADDEVFERVGQVLLPDTAYQPARILAPADAWQQADQVFQPLLARVTQELADLLGAPVSTDAINDADLDEWRQTYVTASAHEGWATHGAWISANEPGFAPPIAARWASASQITDDAAAAARGRAAQVRGHVRARVGDDAIMVLPSAASFAPLRDAEPGSVDAVRLRTLRITCIAGLAGLPQVSMPFRAQAPGGDQELALGISLVGPAGSDFALIQLARRLWLACAPR